MVIVVHLKLVHVMILLHGTEPIVKYLSAMYHAVSMVIVVHPKLVHVMILLHGMEPIVKYLSAMYHAV
jgi:hypothetical protein